MKDIVELLNDKDDKIIGSPATDKEISEAEAKLGLEFSEEYIKYLQNFGFVCVDGHECVGISKANRVNVVEMTMKEWSKNKFIPHYLYVIEQTNIDDIVIWQASTGEVYQSQAMQKPIKICNSMCEYIKMS